MIPFNCQRRTDMLDRVHDRLVGRGWRLLEDTDVIERSDQTVCLSTLLSGTDDWMRMDRPSPDYGDEWADVVGRVVGEYIASDAEMDGWERVFRRKIKP